MINTPVYGDGEFQFRKEDFVLPPETITPVVSSRPRSRVIQSNKPRRPWIKTTGAFVLGMVGVAIGLPLCITVVFAPVGIGIMFAFCFPLHKLLEAHSKRLDAYYNQIAYREPGPRSWMN